ncbi:MAG: hypothetical protein KGL39_42350 [Patescibacteria group bacterium]|nr:hypothetical protein [Patescibacteria group bacterium]
MSTTLALTADEMAAMFSLEIDPGATAAPEINAARVLCAKCSGKGKFYGYTGRAVGACFACNGTGLASETREVSTDASKIAAAFASATQRGIKRPRLHLDTFKFSRAPDTGKNAGSIYVTERDQYLGRITDGRFLPTRACDDPTRDRVAVVASDPHAAARAYGQRTGQCACCGRELTNGESIALNIGPICRDKYGWV